MKNTEIEKDILIKSIFQLCKELPCVTSICPADFIMKGHTNRPTYADINPEQAKTNLSILEIDELNIIISKLIKTKNFSNKIAKYHLWALNNTFEAKLDINKTEVINEVKKQFQTIDEETLNSQHNKKKFAKDLFYFLAEKNDSSPIQMDLLLARHGHKIFLSSFDANNGVPHKTQLKIKYQDSKELYLPHETFALIVAIKEISNESLNPVLQSI